MTTCNKIHIDGLSFKQYVAINKLALSKLAVPQTRKKRILKYIFGILIIFAIVSVLILFFFRYR